MFVSILALSSGPLQPAHLATPHAWLPTGVHCTMDSLSAFPVRALPSPVWFKQRLYASGKGVGNLGVSASGSESTGFSSVRGSLGSSRPHGALAPVRPHGRASIPPRTAGSLSHRDGERWSHAPWREAGTHGAPGAGPGFPPAGHACLGGWEEPMQTFQLLSLPFLLQQELDPSSPSS